MMIYECTDCDHCANFAYGLRVFCINDNLPPNEVCKYAPVHMNDAMDCPHFTLVFISSDLTFTQSDLVEAERHSKATCNGEVTYEGIVDWVRKELKRREQKEP